MSITLIHLLCIHKRISCVYTRDLLRMHNTLVHALGQGPRDPKRQLGRSQALDRCLFGSVAPGFPGPEHAQEYCACTRNLVCPFWALAPGFPGPEHAQESCACTRDLLCIRKRFFRVYTRDLLCRHKMRAEKAYGKGVQNGVYKNAWKRRMQKGV